MAATRLADVGIRPSRRGEKHADTLRLQIGARFAETDHRCPLCNVADRSEDAADRHVGDEPHHDERQQRAQVARSDAREIAAGTAAGEYHAVAEHQTTEDVAEPIQVGTEIHRLGQCDDAGCVERLGADDGGGAGQQPGPEAAIIAERHDVGDRAHRTEIGPEHDVAEYDSDEQAADGEPGRRISGNHLT